MLKRKGLILAAAFALAILGVGTFFVISKPVDRVTPENCRQLADGMTEHQVMDVLGPPSENAVDFSIVPASFGLKWVGRQHYILVWFDEQGCVVNRDIQPLPKRTWWQWLGRWCGL